MKAQVFSLIRSFNFFKNTQLKYAVILFAWTVLVVLSLIYSFHSIAERAQATLKASAQATLYKDLAFRNWATSHGGVYVLPSERTPSNPYLDHPFRDIETTDGMILTLMNPAYMLRDMQQNFPDQYGVLTNITSLRPLNPNNIADEWEVKVLQYFDSQEHPEPYFEITHMGGEPYARMMAPFTVEANCLQCHAHQGFKLGEVRGGIGTAVPMADALQNKRERQWELLVWHSGLWAVGMIFFLIGWRREWQLEREHEQSVEALKESQALHKSVVNNGQALIWLADTSRQCTYFNQVWLNFTGRRLQQELGEGWMESLHPDDVDHWLHEYHRAFDLRENFQIAYRLRRHDGEYRWFVDEGAPRYNSKEEFVGYIGHCLDITQLKEAQNEIDNLVHFDVLTHLPNRQLMMQRLQQAVAVSVGHGQYGALVLIDLDNFKLLNDSVGHEIGDQLLQQVSKRLQAAMPSAAMVGRFGGDEFILLFEQLDKKESVAVAKIEGILRTILDKLRQPYPLLNKDYQTTPSLGITLFKGKEIAAEELMKNAEVAMYQAKESGRNTLRFFDPQMQALVSERSDLESALRYAVRTQEFALYLQPQVDMNERLIGAEALLRWPHPTRGLVSPIEFIPLAEETGLIVPLGRWVLERACHTLAHWQTQPQMAGITIAVNVSARQFQQADFVEQVLDVLEQSGADASCLKLELTESLFVIGMEQVLEKMHLLKARGVRFSLDDFGTGYSSLAYLKRLPLDQLKIDQGFVRDILVDHNDRAIAKMVVALSQTLDLDVIAEGVETQAQQQELLHMGCMHYQGYYYGRPMPIDEFEQVYSETK